MASIEVGQLRDKVRNLQSLGGDRLTQVQIAEALDIKPPTLHGYIKSGMVPEKHFNALCEILISQSPRKISAAAASALWLGDKADFKSALLTTIPVYLDDVLQKCTERIDVKCHPVPDGFGLDEEVIDLGDDPQPMQDGTRFFLSMTCVRRTKLVVFSSYSTGWRVLAPGKLHNGNVTAEVTRFPQHDNETLTFRSRHGLRKYVVIEHDPKLDPQLRPTPGLEPLHPEDVANFARLLLSDDWVGQWRWGQAVLTVAPSVAREPER